MYGLDVKLYLFSDFEFINNFTIFLFFSWCDSFVCVWGFSHISVYFIFSVHFIWVFDIYLNWSLMKVKKKHTFRWNWCLLNWILFSNALYLIVANVGHCINSAISIAIIEDMFQEISQFVCVFFYKLTRYTFLYSSLLLKQY